MNIPKHGLIQIVEQGFSCESRNNNTVKKIYCEGLTVTINVYGRINRLNMSNPFKIGLEGLG